MSEDWRNELVTKGEAIDAIEKNAYRHTYLDQIIDIIKSLPSAQPEKTQLSGESTTKDSTFDCISRQVAIDALNSMKIYRPLDSDRYVISDCLNKIVNLPSAQPQLDTCPIYGGMCGYPSNLCYECPRHEGAHEKPLWWTEGLQPFAQPQRWIPVSERLPEKDGRYFVTLENGYTKILGYATTQTIRYPQGFYYISENGFAWRQTQNPVVAWMPLPEPYKGGQGWCQ